NRASRGWRDRVTAGAIGRATPGLTAAGFFWLLLACGMAPSDVARGHAVAERWCSECRRVASRHQSRLRVSGRRPILVMPTILLVHTIRCVACVWLCHGAGASPVPRPPAA